MITTRDYRNIFSRVHNGWAQKMLGLQDVNEGLTRNISHWGHRESIWDKHKPGKANGTFRGEL